MNLLCKLGIHRPLTLKGTAFFDVVSGRAVHRTSCPCGQAYLTTGGRWFGFKTKLDEEDRKFVDGEDQPFGFKGLV